MFLMTSRNESENQEMSGKIGSAKLNPTGSAKLNPTGSAKLTLFHLFPVLYQNGAHTSSRRNQSAHVGNLHGNRTRGVRKWI
jgi:hypothetical protein